MCTPNTASAPAMNTKSKSSDASVAAEHDVASRHVDPRKRFLRRQSSVSEVSIQFTTGSLVSGLVVMFSIYFPFLLAPWAASETYHYAFYEYDPDISHFDNSLWTYGTDYFLAFTLSILLFCISLKNPVSRTHAWRSRGLLACYIFSVLAGGIAHQFYTTLESRNTAHFRALWTVCVGTVTAASLFMGTAATELVRMDHERHLKNVLPILPEWFWIAYGLCTTLVCVLGGISFQRPACDIFIAGITQFPPTAYMVAVLAVGLPTHPVPQWTRIWGIIGFILNAPLLPLYPLLVQYTNLSLAEVNTILHMWLWLAWGLQGIALRRIEIAIARDAMPPPSMIPIKCE